MRRSGMSAGGGRSLNTRLPLPSSHCQGAPGEPPAPGAWLLEGVGCA
jgi:hypothetical protein